MRADCFVQYGARRRGSTVTTPLVFLTSALEARDLVCVCREGGPRPSWVHPTKAMTIDPTVSARTTNALAAIHASSSASSGWNRTR